MQQNYPTKWTGGKPKGGVYEKEKEAHYQVRIAKPYVNEYFRFKDYPSKQKAKEAAEKFLKEKSDELGLTVNKFRYIDQNTIEVKLIEGDTMKTDAKFLKIINKYNVGKTQGRQGDRYYIICRRRKENPLFTKLITTHKPVKYINNDTMDVRICNLDGNGTEIDPITDSECELNDNEEKNNSDIKNENDSDDEIIDFSDLKNVNSTGKKPKNQITQEERDKIMYNINNTSKYEPNVSKSPECLPAYRLWQFFKAKTIVESKKGKMLSNHNDYVLAYSYLKVECENKHIFDATLNNLTAGRWCPECNIHINELVAKYSIEHLTDKKFKKIRPDWLENDTGYNLELDAYNEELNLGLEYHGQQHYQFMKHFHESQDIFEKRKKDDKHKEELCEEHETKLVIVPYTTKTDDICKFVYKKLIEFGYEIDEAKVSTFKKNIIMDEITNKTDELKKLLEKEGSKLIDGVHLTNDSLVTIECPDGHEHNVYVKNILYGKGALCPDRPKPIKSEETRDKTAIGVKKYNEKPEGKQKKKESHAKRSVTMAKAKEEKSKISRKECKNPNCLRKGEEQPISEFCKKAASADTYQPNCKTCNARIKREWREKERNKKENDSEHNSDEISDIED